jgi:nucleoid-associated protein YgaU
MQSGVKIGLAVGGFIAVVATAYFVLSSRSGGTTQVANAPGQGNKPQNQIVPTPERPANPVPGKAGEPAPAGAQGPVKTGGRDDVFEIRVDTPKGKETPKSPTEAPKDNTTPGGTEEPLKTPPDKASPTMLASKTPADVYKPEPAPKAPEPKARGSEDLIVDVRAKTVVEPTPRTATTQPGPTRDEEYTVQSGDSFYLIAQKKYGDGKYFSVIAKANPGVDSSRMHVGQKLILPPLPKETAVTTTTGNGGPTVNANGQTVYTVKAGDSFWVIAEKHYGNGKYFYLINEANPKVDSRSLKAGQQIILPPKPLSATTSAAGTTTRPSGYADPIVRPGEEVYVVQAGDNGFWGIAAKKYGDGNLMGAIAKANPNVEPTRLHVGQKLVLPSIEEARKMLGLSSPTTRPSGDRIPATTRERPRERPRTAVDDGRPVFD